MKKKKIVKDSYIVRTKKRILRDTIETEKNILLTLKILEITLRFLINLYLIASSILLMT